MVDKVEVIRIRCEPDLRERILRLAQKENAKPAGTITRKPITSSDIIRQAVLEFLEKHGG